MCLIFITLFQPQERLNRKDTQMNDANEWFIHINNVRRPQQRESLCVVMEERKIVEAYVGETGVKQTARMERSWEQLYALLLCRLLLLGG